MRINKKLSVLLVMLFLGAMATQVIAQPSIPRRYGTTKKKSTTVKRSGTWGTEYDIRYKDAGQIRVLKNSIYARHGYIFKDSNLRAYFNSCWWYNGYRSVVPTSAFNKYEKANIQFLGRYDH